MKVVGLFAFQYGIVLLVIIFYPHQGQCVRPFHRHKVLRVTPQTEDHVISLRELLLSRDDVDAWKDSSIPGKEVHINIGPDAIEDFKVNLAKRSLGHEIMIEDTQAAIDSELACCSSDINLDNGDDFDTCYHSLDAIHNEMGRLKKKHPDLVTLKSLGQSFEKRDMLGMEIARPETETQGLIVITCGIHAREWISHATCMYIVRQMLNSKDDNGDIAYMLNTFKWFFLPVYNVDGYVYTRNVDRLWRKNRKTFDNSDCVGVDLNRNFPNVAWEKNQHINNTCGATYPGVEPLSEIETRNVVQYLTDHRSELVSYFDLHSYSQLFLSPWGRRSQLPQEYSIMEHVMKVATKAIKDTSGKVYTYGPSYTTIYPVNGVSIDYTYDTLKVTHSYSAELRPTDDGADNGFLLTPCEIIPTGNEMLAALKAIMPILAQEKENKSNLNVTRELY